jgi:hypothetical protein
VPDVHDDAEIRRRNAIEQLGQIPHRTPAATPAVPDHARDARLAIERRQVARDRLQLRQPLPDALRAAIVEVLEAITLDAKWGRRPHDPLIERVDDGDVCREDRGLEFSFPQRLDQSRQVLLDALRLDLPGLRGTVANRGLDPIQADRGDSIRARRSSADRETS